MAEDIKDFMNKMNKKLKKNYGDANVVFLGNEVGNFIPLPTGFPTMDWLNVGIGGLPRGGMTLVKGLESTGKSSLCLEIMEHNMKVDPNFKAFYIDVENSLTDDFLKFKHVDGSRLVTTSLNNEDALIQVEEALKANIFDMIVFDSIAKWESQTVMDKDIDESVQRGLRAKRITEFLRRISFVLRQSKTALVFINQLIQNQDASPYGPKTILPGGMQQKYSANMIIDLKRVKSLKENGKHIGYKMQILSEKNKVAPNEKVSTELVYLFGRGFIREYSILDYLISIGEVKKLQMGKHEFVKKEYYPSTFRVGEIGNILESIKSNFNVDLSATKPPANIDLVKVEDPDDVKDEEVVEV